MSWAAHIRSRIEVLDESPELVASRAGIPWGELAAALDSEDEPDELLRNRVGQALASPADAMGGGGSVELDEVRPAGATTPEQGSAR